MYRLFILGLLGSFYLSGCTSRAGSYDPTLLKPSLINHFNLIFAPDLSNRVDPGICRRPLNDSVILSIVAQDLYPYILRFRRSEDQKDKLRVDFINKGLITQY